MRGLARGGAARYIKALAALALDGIAARREGLRTPSQAPRMTTKWVNVEAIGSYFQSLSDPRHTRNRKLELAQALRRDPAEASSRQGQPSRQDDPLHDEYRLSHGSPYFSRGLIRAGRAAAPKLRG